MGTTTSSGAGAGGPRRAVRRVVALACTGLLVVGGLVAGLLAAPPAQAAGARVLVTLTDPLSIDPVRLQVAAADADGWATAFTGTVTLSSGRTSTTVPVRSPIGQAEVSVPTAALAGGPVKATVVLRAGGRTIRTAVAGIVDLPATVALRGFGCGVVTPAQPRIPWQVVALNGAPVVHPAWTPAADTYPAYLHAVRPRTIVDSDGQPVSTRGTVTILRGTTKVVVLPVRPAVRRLLFSTPWAGTVRGRFAPGTYTAVLRLVDASGRPATASRTVTVARSAVGLCL